MKINYKFLEIIVCGLILSGCTSKQSTPNTSPTSVTPAPTTTVAPSVTSEKSEYEKVCSWVDKSDVIVKVTLGEGAVEDSSFEAGFMYYKNGSKLAMRDVRVARKACDYKTGFTFAELKGKGAVEMIVSGYSDNRVRQIKGEPISVVIDETGHPDKGNLLELTITN